MKLSVIVPVYNAAEHLQRCLDALLQQGMGEEEYEIICVDDGSTDASLQVLQSYAERHRCVVVTRQENQGAGAARNTGLAMARGELVAFCDADDYLVPGAYRYLLDMHWQQDTQLLCFHSVTMDQYMQREWREPDCLKSNVLFCGGGREAYLTRLHCFVWQMIIQRQFLQEHRLCFEKFPMAEDALFCLELMMAGPRTVECDANVYRYCVHERQLTRRRDKVAMLSCLTAYRTLRSRMLAYANAMEDPAQRNAMLAIRKTQRIPYWSRLLSANLSVREAWHFDKRLAAVYPLYRCASWLHRKVFVPYCLPRMRRNAKIQS